MNHPKLCPKDLFLLAPLLLWGGCGSAPDTEFRVDTRVDGRVVVSNPPPADSPTEDRLEIPELQLVEELRIGVAEGSGPESFGRIAGLETDPEGRIYVADGLAYEIRVFDRTGRHLLSFGGKGREPVPCA